MTTEQKIGRRPSLPRTKKNPPLDPPLALPSSLAPPAAAAPASLPLDHLHRSHPSLHCRIRLLVKVRRRKGLDICLGHRSAGAHRIQSIATHDSLTLLGFLAPSSAAAACSRPTSPERFLDLAGSRQLDPAAVPPSLPSLLFPYLSLSSELSVVPLCRCRHGRVLELAAVGCVPLR